VATFTAPTVLDCSPTAPDPVTGVTLTTTAAPYVTAPLLPSLVDYASLTPKPSQENADSSELPVSNAVLKFTKYQEPVIPAVAQALPSPPVAALLHADSATNAMSDDILSYAQPPQVTCFPTAPTATPTAAPTAFDRPPAAPDPVTGVTLFKNSDPAYDCTPAIHHSEMQHAHPPNEAVLLITTVGNTVMFGHSSLPPVLAYDPNSAVPYYPSSAMILCPDNLGYCILAPYQHLLHFVHGMTKKTYLLETNQDDPQTRNNKEVSYTASRKFPVEEGTFYASVESPFTPDDPVGDLIALLSSDLLPSPSSRLAQDPLEEMCLTYYCNQHPLACGVTSPLIFPCINNKHLPLVLDTLATLECFDLLYNQCSFLVSDKVPTQCSLVNLCVPILEDIEEEIIFYYSDDEGDDNEDVIMEIELCMPFGTQLFPHHNDSCSQQYLCEVVPSSREVIFIDGEPLPAITKEPYVGESVVCEPACFGGPKGTITSSVGFYLGTYGLTQDPALIASISDGEQTIWENLAAGYAQDVYPQVFPDSPFYVSLLPSDSINESMMAVVKDETQTHGTKYTWTHVLVKVGGYTQGFQLTKIPCATKSIALSFTVYGMLTPLPFDRGKMVSSHSPPYPHAASLPISPRPYQASLVHPSLPPSGTLEGVALLPRGVIISLWEVTTCTSSCCTSPCLAE